MPKKNAAAAVAPQEAPSQSLLKTKIKDLTPEQIAKLERPLGTSHLPYPMFSTERIEDGGHTNLEMVLSFISNDMNPLMVYSERPMKEVIALAYCDMPVPSMLDLFKAGLERRAPNSTNRSQMMIGDPGAGKSYLGALQGRMRSKDKIEIWDCGGKNMNELLFEMVLDFGTTDALPKAIDKRLKAGVLEPLSLAKLKQLPSGALNTDNGGLVSIDWGYFKGSASADDVESAFKIIKEVSQLEGLDHQAGNALGMNSQYGPLIRWFQEGKEGVLDEYNKSREGSDNGLQTVLQFLIGEMPVVEVQNPLKNKDEVSGPASFTFRREDMKAGFFVTLTGNKTEDGSTTRSLNKSVYSRLSPRTLPDPTIADWQHRICQMMIGLPVSTIYSVFQEQADKNPTAFGEWLLDLRRTKAQIEGVPVPELQETLIKNWQNVVRSTEKLAQFYDQWATLSNTEKVTRVASELQMEVDEEYTKKEGIDFRKIKQHLEEAVPMRPQMEPSGSIAQIDFKNFDKIPVVAEKFDESVALNFGTRLVDFLDRTVYEKTEAVSKPKLYQRLLKAMEEFGLRDVNLIEGAHSQQKSVEEDLNISAFDSPDPTKRAQLARKVFCDYIRLVEPEITADDEFIITIQQLRSALETVGQRNTAETKELSVLNRDHETLGDKPLADARIEDTAEYALRDEEELNFEITDLVTYEDFMASLAIPTVGPKNLAAIWEKNIRSLSERENGSATGPDESIEIAENTSNLGVATTTLLLGHGGANVSVHIVMNKARNKTLIVGEAVSSKLQAAFREAGIIHVDRHDPKARIKIESALNDLTRSMPDSAKGRLADAFKYRNAVAQGNTQKLSELMVDDKLEMEWPKFVVKGRRGGPKL